MSRPKCPNHTVEMDPTDEPHIWICPISDCRFEADVDVTEEEGERKVDMWGNIKEEKKWKVKQLDGGQDG